MGTQKVLRGKKERAESPTAAAARAILFGNSHRQEVLALRPPAIRTCVLAATLLALAVGGVSTSWAGQGAPGANVNANPATGGNGGNGAVDNPGDPDDPGAPGGAGGIGHAQDVVVNGTASSSTASATATGGRGGDGARLGAGGQGGGGEAEAVASAINTASATATATGGGGGAGGAGVGGFSGGPGGFGAIASGTAAASASGTSGSATATLNLTGGDGGHGIFGGGLGGSVSAFNAVTGSALGTLTLEQNVTGGNGGRNIGLGFGVAATAGSGGSAVSMLSIAATGMTAPQSLSVTATAHGGNAGFDYGEDGSLPGLGGSATVSAVAVGGHAVTVSVTGVGGAGTDSYEAEFRGFGVAGDGGMAFMGPVTGLSTGGENVTVTATITGGRGGGLLAPSYGGNGATVYLTGVVGAYTSGSATASATGTFTGGNGGESYLSGGFGGNVVAANNVAGSTGATGTLTLEQNAIGGNGGTAGTDSNGGIGGYAISSINRTASAAAFTLSASATGGKGGSGDFPGVGGSAMASAVGKNTTGSVSAVATGTSGKGGTDAAWQGSVNVAAAATAFQGTSSGLVGTSGGYMTLYAGRYSSDNSTSSGHASVTAVRDQNMDSAVSNSTYSSFSGSGLGGDLLAFGHVTLAGGAAGSHSSINFSIDFAENDFLTTPGERLYLVPLNPSFGNFDLLNFSATLTGGSTITKNFTTNDYAGANAFFGTPLLLRSTVSPFTTPISNLSLGFSANYTAATTSTSSLSFVVVGSAAGESPFVTWIEPAGGTWQSTSNWSSGTIPNSAGIIAVFPNYSTPVTITHDGWPTIGGMILAGPGYTFDPGTYGNIFSWLTIQSSGGTGGFITASEGDHVFNCQVVSGGNLDIDIATGASITFAFALSLGDRVILTKNGGGSLTLDTYNHTGADPSYVINGGTLNMNVAPAVSSGNASFILADGTTLAATVNLTATFINNGGTITSDHVLAFKNGSRQEAGTISTSSSLTFAGTVEFAGGNLTSSANVSTSSVGNLNLTGGTIATTGNYTNSGTVNASGGSLSSANFTNNSTGNFVGTGSTITASGTMTNNGTLSISSGSLASTGNATIGTTGVTSVSGGTLSTAGTLTVNGAVTVSGGTLSTASNATISSTGTANISGGTIAITGTTTLDGALHVTGGTLNSTGNTTVGSTGVATISGGTFTTAGAVTNGGTVSVSAGTVSTGDFTNNSTVSITGGSVSTGNISGSGQLTVSGGGSLTATRIRQDSLTIGASTVTITASSPTLPSTPAGNDSYVSVVNSLSINTNTSGAFLGTLDLKNNDLIIDYTGGSSPLTLIESMIASGYNSGTWTGTGITSSIAATNPSSYTIGIVDNALLPSPYDTFDGIDTSSHEQIIIKFTWLDDLDLDGLVTSNDAIRFATYYSAGNPQIRMNGDIDYDGYTTSNDAIRFATAYNASLPHLPEPGCLGILGVGSLALLTRRRRSR